MQGNSKKKNFLQRLPREVKFGSVVALAIGAIIYLLFRLEESGVEANSIELNMILGVLCSVIASFIFLVIQQAFDRDEHQNLSDQLNKIDEALQHQNTLYDSGINSIRPKSQIDKKDDVWRDIIRNTEGRLDLIGHSLSKWFQPEYEEIFCKTVENMLKNGKKVRIVLSAKQFCMPHVYAACRGEIPAKHLLKVEKTALRLVELVKDMFPKERNNLELYVTDPSKVTYMYIRTDQQTIISPYIFSPSNGQNTFLLELQSESPYAKTFDADFRELIENMDCIDLEVPKKEEVYLRPLHCLKCRNQYSGHDWNREETWKYVYREGPMELEAGYFEHYSGDTFVKAVLELPVSYGCPAKCSFCATSAISEFLPLSAGQMTALFEELYQRHEVHKKQNVVLSLTGMGDIFFNPNNVIEFLQGLTAYPNLEITLSSCLWNRDLLERVSRLEKLRHIQITFVSGQPDIMCQVMPVYVSHTLDFKEILDFIKASGKSYFRINYIMIKGLNDSDEDFQRLGEMLAEVKSQVTVRISKLNETKATERNSLSPAETDRALELERLLCGAGIKSYQFYAVKNDHMNCGQLVTEK